MTGRDKIMAALRRNRMETRPLPRSSSEWIQYESPRQQFVDVLQSVGGEARVVANAREVVTAVSELNAYRNALNRCCDLVLPNDGTKPRLDWNVPLDDVKDPHDLASLDFALLAAHFAVAENGAVWVTYRQRHLRSVPVVAQHVAFVVPADQIVHNMHQAYDRISLSDVSYGCFVSGPSKTADIEQSLVIGAHGARSVIVFLVEEANPDEIHEASRKTSANT